MAVSHAAGRGGLAGVCARIVPWRQLTIGIVNGSDRLTAPPMNCLFFTTVFNVFTTDFHFFTTPPSILTTPPSILTTLSCSLRSEICCYLGLGRHAAHKINP
jgi:hypothetical protein